MHTFQKCWGVDIKEGRVGKKKGYIGLMKFVDSVGKGDNSVQPIHPQNEENPWHGISKGGR